MPTPRVPTSILEARGAYKKDPQRARSRASEPVVHASIGSYPKRFLPKDGYDGGNRPELREIWDEIISDAAPGVLNRSHRIHLETTCGLVLKQRHDLAKSNDITNLNKYLTQMGMNPGAQSTVTGVGFTPAGGTSAIGKLAARQAQVRTA